MEAHSQELKEDYARLVARVVELEKENQNLKAERDCYLEFLEERQREDAIDA